MQLLKYLSLLYFQFDVDLTLIIISTAIGFFLHCVPPSSRAQVGIVQACELLPVQVRHLSGLLL